ncbi:nucleoside transporter C-terminal domain-containing protein [Clostridium perfringens]|uniref:Nucleoside transporter, NupC family n=1 Tax=Clostridium perfringens (strain ATCC 13124 / DSM 756 / JCM 1290 / NCIMB 6125 / NCTC 8237 / Type A) TaxID=195103 RepID=A0A0H2YQR2_CLOP1|nr:nucleoside transporter C-terminal domain-containing protein [Clostridium perfringens]ABG83246.1 nucleoside transporter, NupC family [Clostridium perfringens ATCC 13124]EGT0690406.1 NupC/NupG family nucleoside CNT transporter [Clostridium perfringens]EGT4142067.1 NupC/NupG family nucleoside CNT transporter [Clostridium perfringens]EIF2086245.1 NupC/NupG family nucleoside CNT transporter [Clostridium perfringens]EIF2806753.1 NupC/NupG family nucleoside CNT transporter [Clostridium perfringens
MKYIIGVVGLIVILALAWIGSSDKKNIKYKPIFLMLILQFVLGFILLNTQVGNYLVGSIANGFDVLLACAGDGVNFVFGGLVNNDQFSFFISVLLPIIFISALIGILQYLKILPFVIKYIGLVLSKINGMGKLESYNAVASAILGQSEVFISVKKELALLPKHRLYTLCASAMSTVSMSIVGSYMVLLQPRYVVTAIVLNLFGGFIIASVINPYSVSAEEDILVVEDEKKQTFFEVLGEYILDGFKVAVIVAAMLVGFVAIIAVINMIFRSIFGMSFQEILGYVFSPFAFLMGVPLNESIQAASVMATKLVSNEFVAMNLLSSGTLNLSARSIGIVSVFLISFANFSSIGIISGAVKGLNQEQGNVVARFGLKLLYGATLVSMLTATIVGLII